MKKYFEATPNLDGLKEKIIVLKDGEDRKTLIAVIALVAAVLIAVLRQMGHKMNLWDKR